MNLYAVSLFLLVYVQAVLKASPERSGVDLLASVISMVPFAIIGGHIYLRGRQVQASADHGIHPYGCWGGSFLQAHRQILDSDLGRFPGHPSGRFGDGTDRDNAGHSRQSTRGGFGNRNGDLGIPTQLRVD